MFYLFIEHVLFVVSARDLLHRWDLLDFPFPLSKYRQSFTLKQKNVQIKVTNQEKLNNLWITILLKLRLGGIYDFEIRATCSNSSFHIPKKLLKNFSDPKCPPNFVQLTKNIIKKIISWLLDNTVSISCKTIRCLSLLQPHYTTLAFFNSELIDSKKHKLSQNIGPMSLGGRPNQNKMALTLKLHDSIRWELVFHQHCQSIVHSLNKIKWLKS